MYERLKRQKGARSFSEVIEEALEGGTRIQEMAGGRVLDEQAYWEAKRDIRRAHQRTPQRLGP